MEIDYDHPYRDRLPVIRQYAVALVLAACLGLVWALDDVVDFVALRTQASSTTAAVVVGYEVAGGRERIRVQVSPDKEAPYFMLVGSTTHGPRYAKGQAVKLFSFEYANSAGQPLTQTVAYAPRNYWTPTTEKALFSLAILIAAGIAFAWPRKDRTLLAGHPA